MIPLWRRSSPPNFGITGPTSSSCRTQKEIPAGESCADIPDGVTLTVYPVAQPSLFDQEDKGTSPETFTVNIRGRAPLVDFIESALRDAGCAIIGRSSPGEAPFRISFLTPWGERIGIVAYAFTANSRLTKNRPGDEHRFQVKYGSKDGRSHNLWQDPFGLYTTVFVGINVEGGFFVGADPVLNSPTKFFISKEFKQEEVDRIFTNGWHAWEREQRRRESSDPVEVLVGGKKSEFLRYILFEREVLGEDQGHRQLIAERYGGWPMPSALLTTDGIIRDGFDTERDAERFGGGRYRRVAEGLTFSSLPPTVLHRLEREFDLGATEILELIAGAPRLKMAVRGWVAERHLQNALEKVDAVARVEPIEEDGQPDFRVELKRKRRPVLVECKNVLRTKDKHGRPRLDFMRTRASPVDPCSRYYSPEEFDVLAACLHASSERWEFAARRTSDMAPHRLCPGRLEHRVLIDASWERDLETVLLAAANA